MFLVLFGFFGFEVFDFFVLPFFPLLEDRHLFGDEEERQAKEFIETSRIPGAGVRIPDQWIKDKDRMGAIRERTALAEKHYRAKDGSE